MLPLEEFAHVTVVHSGSPFEILRGRYVRQRFAPHAHDTYAIGSMMTGAATCVSRGEETTHATGDLITIEPGAVHTGGPLTAQGWSYRMLYIPREVMARCWNGDGQPPRFENTGVADSELSSRIAHVHALLEGSEDPLHQESALIATLRAICERHAQLPAARAHGASPGALQKVREYLEENFADHITLADLSRVSALSAFHLIRQFRRYYGMPPHRYLEVVRVERAKLLLRGGARISDAAYATGFSDQSHLTRHFKRVIGVTPGSYAQSYR